MLKPRLYSKIFVLTLLFCLPAVVAVAALVLPAGETVWQGEVALDQPVQVPRNSRLVIRPGTQVRVTMPSAGIDVAGTIRVAGTEAQPVVFISPSGWQGVSFVEAEKGSSFSGARFAGAEAAISSIATDFSVTGSSFTDCGTAIKLLRESSPLIENNHFEKNDMAIDNEMKSAPTIRHNRFIGHRKTAILASHNSRGLIADNRFEDNEQGLGLLQSYPDKILNNLFINNKVALYCNQTKNTPLIKSNRFERNEMALVNFSFSYPVVEDNKFIDNKMAVRNDQYGSPRIHFNHFSGNGTAVYNYRKSNPDIQHNIIEQGDLALFCDYSSYPVVKNNHFSANRMAVELGIYQSADWEKRSGSKVLMQKEALARNSKNTMLRQAPTQFNDRVDVSGNWWAESMPELLQAEKGANLPFFFDRLDKEWVTYEGFGPESYRIDLVVYRPWLEQPVANAGPRKN